MTLTGEVFIGAARQRGGGDAFPAINPASNTALTPDFHDASAEQVDRACELARRAARPWRDATPVQRAELLERIGDNIMALGETLIQRAMQETALPQARLEGERARTVGQLRMFAAMLRSGEWLQPVIEPALPERKPLPRPDLRQRQIALGPVAVFGASNFPLAFSVAGGDSASALAAGCPLVVKAHPAHPGTSELVASAVQAAVKTLGLPEGVFSMLHGASHKVGEQLVSHPAIQAVGFTGSRAGGMALIKRVQSREIPIPIYAEMSSINPLIILPTALAQHSAQLAQNYADSLTLGVGQFCTNPGLILLPAGEAADLFASNLAQVLQSKSAGTMLTKGIASACRDATERLDSANDAERLASGAAASGANQAAAAVFKTDAASFISSRWLQQEIFGPVALLVSCRDVAEMQQIVDSLEGQLTITLQLEQQDNALASTLLPSIEEKAGRLLVNGYPTGVDVGHAMVHGGPWPATSDVRTTSVGASAILRFVRPICYQDFPDALLPQELRR
ncbi:aldehyde dehydrogenase (NADP(+)) [Izhakiella australiensis]|uniref:2,5-dioxovalerate dehydrogenase n=1 Tax=Izhakiella australiensis TaxID=1926881 RepID=A0A1S8YMC3_9GAMM|nr:aldehyde dehydrogenase (NADP(+)) [Izhakiella australiensis]OON39803.1 aldehyde dehydrogenase (NADP(+)) [Izhakiella australiensis]